MTLWPFKKRDVEAHRQLLGTLWLLLKKVRRHGLLSIAGDVDAPAESALFTAIGCYDTKNELIYTFVCDVFRLLIYGSDQDKAGAHDARESMARYMGAYRQTAALKRGQQAMFEVARLSLLALAEGHPPAVAIEHGRQGVPAWLKPGFVELEVFLHGVENMFQPGAEALATKLDAFYDSIGAPVSRDKEECA